MQKRRQGEPQERKLWTSLARRLCGRRRQRHPARPQRRVRVSYSRSTLTLGRFRGSRGTMPIATALPLGFGSSWATSSGAHPLSAHTPSISPRRVGGYSNGDSTQGVNPLRARELLQPRSISSVATASAPSISPPTLRFDSIRVDLDDKLNFKYKGRIVFASVSSTLVVVQMVYIEIGALYIHETSTCPPSTDAPRVRSTPHSSSS